MPYVSDENLEEQNQSNNSSSSQPAGQVSGNPNATSGSTQNTQDAAQTQNQSTQAPQAPTLASGGGSTAAGSASGKAGGAPAPFNSAAPSSSGNWTNLQNYLNSNNGGQFGQEFAGNIGNNVTQAQNSISNAATGFQQAVNSDTVNDNQSVDSEVGSNPQNMSSGDQSTFENELNGSYGGPQNANSYGAFQTAAFQEQNAENEAQEAQTAGGQQALLQQNYNTPTYTEGQQGLDTAILSSDPNAQAALQSLAQQASSLPVSYQNATAAANNEAAQGQATTAQTQATAENDLYGAGGSFGAPTGGAIGNLENTLTNQATNDKTTFDQEQSDIENAISTGNMGTLTPAEQQIVQGLNISLPDFTGPKRGPSQFGGPVTPYTSAYGVTESPYLTANPDSNINVSTEATAEQAAQMNALASLAGQSTDPFLNSTLAGTAPAAPVSFNQAGYSNAIQTAQVQYTQAASAINSQIQALSNTPAGMAPPTAKIQELEAQMNALNAQYGLPAGTSLLPSGSGSGSGSITTPGGQGVQVG